MPSSPHTPTPFSQPLLILSFDCLSYESVVGTFESAIPLETSFFRESWGELERLVGNADRDAPIMTYCTGGIRCVKVKSLFFFVVC